MRATTLFGALAALVVFLECLSPTAARAESTSFTGGTINWSVGGLEHLEYLGQIGDRAYYLADFPKPGEPVSLQAALQLTNCGSKDCSTNSQALYTRIGGLGASYKITTADGPPCPTLNAEITVPYFYDTFFGGNDIAVSAGTGSYTPGAECHSPGTVSVYVAPRNPQYADREDDRMLGGPEDNPDRVFDGGDEGDGPGSGPEGPERTEDVAEQMNRIVFHFTDPFSPDRTGVESDSGDGAEGMDSGGETCRMGLPSYWVDTFTLTPVVKDTDFFMKSPGPAVVMTRTWNHDPDATGMFGRGWSFSYDSSVICRNMYQSLQNWALLFLSPPDIWAEVVKGSGQHVYFKKTSFAWDENYNVTSAVFASQSQESFDTLSGTDLHSPAMALAYTEKSTRTTWTYAYDSLLPETFDMYAVSRARLAAVSDRNDNAVTITRNPDGTIAAVIDAAGRATIFGYDENLRCTSMTTPDGRAATYEYDGSGNMVRTADLLGTVTEYAYDAANRLTSVTVGDKTVVFTWAEDAGDGWDRLFSMTDAEGATTTYALDPLDGFSTIVTDPLCRATRYANIEGKTTAITDPEGRTASVYRANGLPVSVTDPRGNTRLFAYDNRGNLTESADALGYTRAFAYDEQDNLTAVTDALEETFSLQRDARGNLAAVVDPDGGVERYFRDARGQLTAVVDANGYTTDVARDAWGNIVAITDPLGHTVRGEYDAHGILPASVTDALGNTTRLEYDNNHRLIGVLHPDGTSRTFSYDACSLVSVTDENGHTSTVERDRRLSLVRSADPLGNAIRHFFDAAGDLSANADSRGFTTTYSRDGSGRLITVTDPLKGKTQAVLDENGNMTQLTEPGAGVYRFEYDARNQVTKTTDPLTRAVSWTRDALGRAATKTNARGQVLSFAYDAVGRSVEKSFNGETEASYSYDKAGRLLSVTDRTGTTTLTRNARGEVTGLLHPDGTSLRFGYDAAGNLTSMTLPGGVTVTTAYDNRNRPTRVAWGAQWVEFDYDPAGNLIGEKRSNAVATEVESNAADRIVRILHKIGGNVIADLAFQRDRNGNVIRETSIRPVIGHPVSGTLAVSVDGANQLASMGGEACFYDADGNIVSVAGQNGFAASHDPQNRLVSLTRGGETAEFAYNGLGNRVSRTLRGLERRFYHDPFGRLVYEADAGGANGVAYLHVGGRLCAMRLASGKTTFFHIDQSGNTVALTDASGEVAGAWAYTPFGEVAASSGLTENAYTFAGAWGVRDEGGGLYFMTNRWYDARVGRFLEKDPIGLLGGTNLYAYVGNNPVNWLDPLGLNPANFTASATMAIPNPDAQGSYVENSVVNAEMKPNLSYSMDIKFIPGLPIYDPKEPTRSPGTYKLVNVVGEVKGILSNDNVVTLTDGANLADVTRVSVLEDSTAVLVFPDGRRFTMLPNTMVFLDSKYDTAENPCAAATGIR